MYSWEKPVTVHINLLSFYQIILFKWKILRTMIGFFWGKVVDNFDQK